MRRGEGGRGGGGPQSQINLGSPPVDVVVYRGDFDVLQGRKRGPRRKDLE